MLICVRQYSIRENGLDFLLRKTKLGTLNMVVFIMRDFVCKKANGRAKVCTNKKLWSGTGKSIVLKIKLGVLAANLYSDL